MRIVPDLNQKAGALALTTVLLVFALSCGGEETKGPNDAGIADVSLDIEQLLDADVSTPNRPDTAPPVEDDGGAIDTGADTSAPVDFGRTVGNYRTCEFDTECPAGMGACVKEISLSHADADGSTRVRLSDFLVDLEPGLGICTRPCTNGASACSDLSVNGSTPDAEPYVCQIIYVGEAPYPVDAPEMPFADSLDFDRMRAGVSFGAICRPPFQLNDAVDRGFCAPCGTGQGACAGESVCWSYLNDRPAESSERGECLAPCSVEGYCPLGFECEAAGDGASGSLCVPVEESCTVCVDHDGDGFGAGRCGPPEAPVTPFDCDDKNKDAYYDPLRMTHPFPTFCAEENDYNCNGISDALEQIATDAFGADHCGSCFDECRGPVPFGQATCEEGACIPRCDNPNERATCNLELADGCEVEVTDPSLLYYRDADGDGYGDPNEPLFACVAGDVPAGYVSNGDDCNDDDPTIYPGAPDRCNGEDTNCSGTVDDAVQEVGMACDTGVPGICAAGIYECLGAEGLNCPQTVQPQAEDCSAVDRSCSGSLRDIDPRAAVQPAESWKWFRDADGDGFGVTDDFIWDCKSTAVVSNQVTGYARQGGDCDDTNDQVYPGRTEDCSTPYDDNCNGLINAADGGPKINERVIYTDIDGDGYSPTPGTRENYCAPGDLPNGKSLALHNQVDCNDNNRNIYPGAPQRCDSFGPGTDYNCSGSVHDSADAVVHYLDVDGDGYGGTSSRQFCPAYPDPGYVLQGGDCTDIVGPIRPANYGQANGPNYPEGSWLTGDKIYPGATEQCNGYDQSCSGRIDAGCPLRIVPGGSIVERAAVGASWSTTNGYTNVISDCGAGKVMYGLARQVIEPGCNANWVGVYALQVSCATLTATPNRNVIPYTYSVSATDISTNASVGRHTGTCSGSLVWKPGACSPLLGDLKGTSSNSGNGWIETLGHWCGSASLTTEPLSLLNYSINLRSSLRPNEPQASGFWSPSETPIAAVTNCEAGTVPVGMRMHIGIDGYVRGYRLRCRPLEFVQQ